MQVTAAGGGTGTAAISGTDYDAVNATLTFSSDASTQTFDITITDDDIVEGNETFIVSLGAVAGTTETVIATDTAEVTINDNDAAVVTIANITVSESEGDAVIIAQLDNPVAASFDVTIATSDGTADAGDDYTVPTGTLTFAANEQTMNITVPITNDVIVEGAETFTVTVSGSPTGVGDVTVSDTENEATVTITDDDAAVVTIADITVDESEGDAVIIAQLDNPVAASFDVTIATSDGTADAGDDYTVPTNTLTFAANDQTMNITVPITDDAIVESTETFTVTVSGSPTGVGDVTVSGTENVATVTITDNDAADLTIADVEVDESAGTVDVTVQLSNPLSVDLTVNVATAGGTASGAGVDYTAPGATLTFAAGNQTANITVPINNDDIVENDETFTVTVSNPNTAGTLVGDVTVSDGEATVTINEDGMAILSVDDASINEQNGLLMFTIRLDKALADSIRVTFHTEDDTAIAGFDYGALSGGNMTTFNSGDTEQDIGVSIMEDTTVETNEMFTFVASNPTGMQMSRITLPTGGAVGTGTIADSDEAEVTIADITVNESDGNAVITARLDNLVAASFTVDIATANGTAGDSAMNAIAGTDYTAPASTLTFAEETMTADITVPIVNNDIAETTKTFTVKVDTASINPANLFGGRVTVSDSSSVATVTLGDDDTVGITLSPSGLRLTETLNAAIVERSTVGYIVGLRSEPTNDVRIAITSSHPGEVTVAPASLDFTPTNWNAPQRIIVTALHDDDAVDRSAMLTHTASGGNDLSVSSITYAGVTEALTVRVDDDETAGISFSNVPQDSSGNNTVDEGGTISYMVVLDSQPQPPDDVVVTIVSNNTDVTAPEALTFTSLNWDNPQPIIPVTVGQDDDGVDESVILTHRASGNSDYGTENVGAALTIAVSDDDDPGISFNPDPLTVVEEINANYTVRLDTEPTADVVVEIIDDNDELTLSTTSLTFTRTNWSAEQRVTVITAHDADAVDDSVMLTHTATGTSDYVNGDDGLITAALSVTVDDNDTAGITFNPATVTVDEGRNRVYTIVLDTQPTADVTIRINDPSRTIDYNSTIEILPPTVMFTTDTWATPIPVTVRTGEVDDDDDGYMRTFTHTAEGSSDYFTGGGSITEDIAFPVTADLRVMVNDPDPSVSADSRLSMLEISVDGVDLDSDLNPSFDPNETDYELIVDNRSGAVGSTSTVITPTLSDVTGPSFAKAVLVFEETNTTIVSGEGQIIDLGAGKNIIEIIVTAGDDSTRLYTIAVTRLDQVVLNNVRLVREIDADCSSSSISVATVRAGMGYYACVDRFPLEDTSGMVLFTALEGDPTTETTESRSLASDDLRTDSIYEVDITGAPSTLTYLMLTVTIDDSESTHEVRYPIADMELMDDDNDGVPDGEEIDNDSPTNLILTDNDTDDTTIRQITVPSEHRIVLGDGARLVANVSSFTPEGAIYSAEFDTTALDTVGIPPPPGYNGEGIYDFVVYLPATDNIAYIAIPLASSLTAGRSYMKYKNGDWSDFESGPDDEYYSAPGTMDINVNITEFVCPEPRIDAGWAPGLNSRRSLCAITNKRWW